MRAGKAVVFDQGYLRFILLKKGKTERWDVRSVKHGNRLGIIKWYGAWFRYAFFPESDTLFDTGCLKVLQAFIAIRDEVRKHPESAPDSLQGGR